MPRFERRPPDPSEQLDPIFRVPVLIDTVTKLPRLAHTTRRRSDSLVDGVTVA
jgi:hypothetical protein